MSDEERIIQNTEEDQEWADLLSPTRRSFIVGAGLTAAGLTALSIEGAGQDISAADNLSFKPIVPPPDVGKSPWGYETYKEPAPRPKSIRPGEENGLPKAPRPYTDIKSYHAHFYFDDDTYEKAALVRKWSTRAFPSGAWELESATSRPARDTVVLLRLHQRPASNHRTVAAAQQPWIDHSAPSEHE